VEVAAGTYWAFKGTFIPTLRDKAVKANKINQKPWEKTILSFFLKKYIN
jgi:hypothetical protein